MIQSSAGRIFGEANGGRCVGLGITVDQQCRLIGGSEAGREIYSGSRFPNSTFLICNRDDSCQISLNFQSGENLAKSQLRCKLFHVEQKDSCVNFVLIGFQIVPLEHKARRAKTDERGPSSHSVPRGTATICCARLTPPSYRDLGCLNFGCRSFHVEHDQSSRSQGLMFHVKRPTD